MRKDGTYVHVLKNASVLHDIDGNVMGAVETMTDITELVEKDTQIEAFRRELRSEDGFHGILGSSALLHQVFDLITNAAQSDAPVIIFGESGTGKELVARAIHETGIHTQKPYVKVNCASLTESLLESELFGHVKGAFTGAYRSRKGRFEAAQGGSIFLDEIGDLPLATQVKLLRVLEEKVIERVGDNQPIRINVRIITATNRNLKKLVQQGAFREDLFYRINVICAAAAGPRGGHPFAGRIFLPPESAQESEKNSGHLQCGHGTANGLPLAGKRKRAQKCFRVCLCYLPGSNDSALSFPAGGSSDAASGCE